MLKQATQKWSCLSRLCFAYLGVPALTAGHAGALQALPALAFFDEAGLYPVAVNVVFTEFAL